MMCSKTGEGQGFVPNTCHDMRDEQRRIGEESNDRLIVRTKKLHREQLVALLTDYNWCPQGANGPPARPEREW